MLASKLPNPTGEPVQFVDVSMPLKDVSGRLDGVIASHMSWAWARATEQAVMSRLGDRRDMELFVVARDQTVLLAPRSDLHGQSLPLHAVAAAQAGRAGWQVETWPDGSAYVTGYAPAVGYGAYDGLGWVVLARQPVSQAFAPVSALLREIGAAGGVLAILAAFVGWAAVAAAMAPLRRIAAAADRLRKEGTGGLPEFRRPEEIRQVSAALRDLVDSLTRKDQALDAMTDRAHRDPLTGLGNRAALDRFLSASVGPLDALAVLAVDLDGFKSVNDRLGHQAGDRLLQEVARRIGSCVRRRDFAARPGGDEFVVCIGLDGQDDDRVAREIGARLVAVLAQPYDVDGAPAAVGASVGMAVLPRDGGSPVAVLRAADSAIYDAKRSGRGRLVVYGEAAGDGAAETLRSYDCHLRARSKAVEPGGDGRRPSSHTAPESVPR